MRHIWSGVIMLALVAACGDGTGAGDSASTPAPSGRSAEPVASSGPLGSPAGPSGRPAAPSPSPVTPQGGTSKPHKVRWTSAEPLAGGRTLRVVWWSGVEPCHVLDRVEVAERDDRVTVTLYEGSAAASPDTMCIAIALEKYTDVRLSAPLDGRRVVDGAR